MGYKIGLVVTGVDLADEATLAQIASSQLDDLVWTEIDGRVIAVLYTDETDPDCVVVDTKHRVEHALRGARVVRVDDDLVGISDIATRAGVNRETVRTWTTGERGPGDFPAPRGSIGGGTRGPSKVWSWPDVASWLGHRYRLATEHKALHPALVASVNAQLARAEDTYSDWKLANADLGRIVQLPVREERSRGRTPLDSERIEAEPRSFESEERLDGIGSQPRATHG
jgi:hypothetical protein